MRNLQARDFGAISRLVDKMEVKEEVMGLFESVDGLNEDELAAFNKKLQVELVLIILSNYWKAEDEFYKLLASLSGKTKKAVETSSISELKDMFTELSKDEGLKSFFDTAA